MIKDFFSTLTESGELTDKGFFFVAAGTHVFLVSTWIFFS